MDHATHAPSLDRVALRGTVHCLTACSIGEVLGMVLGSAWNWSNAATVLLSITLAVAADTLSITVMEIVDNAMGLVGFPVNHWLIARGRGHALIHGYH